MRNHLQRLEKLESRAPFSVKAWLARDGKEPDFSQLSDEELTEIIAHCEAQLVKDYGPEIAAKISAFDQSATDEELRAVVQGKPCPALDALIAEGERYKQLQARKGNG